MTGLRGDAQRGQASGDDVDRATAVVGALYVPGDAQCPVRQADPPIFLPDRARTYDICYTCLILGG
jgi:hypothetical protein